MERQDKINEIENYFKSISDTPRVGPDTLDDNDLDYYIECIRKQVDSTLSQEQINYQITKTKSFKTWFKILSKENKEKINLIVMLKEDLQDFINNNSLLDN